MTNGVVTIHPDQPLAEAAHLMMIKDIKTLPVVGKNNILVGMLSRIDVLNALAMHVKPMQQEPVITGIDYKKLSDIVQVNVPVVIAEATLPEIIEKMIVLQAQWVIVVDTENHPIGIITDGDLVSRVTGKVRTSIITSLLTRVGLLPTQEYKELNARKLMSAPLLTATGDTDLLIAVGLMVHEKRHRIIIVDSRGILIGIADRRTLLRALLGGYIEY